MRLLLLDKHPVENLALFPYENILTKWVHSNHARITTAYELTEKAVGFFLIFTSGA
jgi:hypothetical protein